MALSRIFIDSSPAQEPRARSVRAINYLVELRIAFRSGFLSRFVPARGARCRHKQSEQSLTFSFSSGPAKQRAKEECNEKNIEHNVYMTFIAFYDFLHSRDNAPELFRHVNKVMKNAFVELINNFYPNATILTTFRGKRIRRRLVFCRSRFEMSQWDASTYFRPAKSLSAGFR
jgi:hypothetical protein